ncbi:MAG: hypothetical protein V8Q84_12080 [Bilophila sp.]
MVVVFDLMLEPPVRKALEAEGLDPVQSVPVRDALLSPSPSFRFRTTGLVMVRAANMKITVERASGTIVNVSGGGCPDVPYLAALLTGVHRGRRGAARQGADPLLLFAATRIRGGKTAMAWTIWRRRGRRRTPPFPLWRRWRLEGGLLHAEDGGLPPLPVRRGTPALLGTALLACEALGAEPPRALLAGDIGDGDGSRRLYGHLAASLKDARVEGLTFHYLFRTWTATTACLWLLELDPNRRSLRTRVSCTLPR